MTAKFVHNQLNAKTDLHSSFMYSEKEIHMFIFKIHIQIYHWWDLTIFQHLKGWIHVCRKSSPLPTPPLPPEQPSTPPPGSRSVAAPHTLPWHDCCGMQGQTEEKIQAFFSWKWDISSWFMLAEELRCSFQPSAQDPFHLCLTFCIFFLVSVTKWSCSTLHLRAPLQSLILQTLPWDTTL